MKTNVNITRFFEWEMFQTEAIEKIKADIWHSIALFYRKLYFYEIIWKKYGRTGQVTDDNTIRRMPCAYWITKATNTHSENVIVIAFAQQQKLPEDDWKLCLYLHCLSR
jgi:hypothetical protein